MLDRHDIAGGVNTMTPCGWQRGSRFHFWALMNFVAVAIECAGAYRRARAPAVFRSQYREYVVTAWATPARKKRRAELTNGTFVIASFPLISCGSVQRVSFRRWQRQSNATQTEKERLVAYRCFRSIRKIARCDREYCPRCIRFNPVDLNGRRSSVLNVPPAFNFILRAG